jgi:hypothetical protein
MANDVNLVQKLTNEINQLREVLSLRKKRGIISDVETELFKLKAENERLKNFVVNNESIERLIQENKMLKLELQKIRTSEDIYSSVKDSTTSVTNSRMFTDSKFQSVGESIVTNSTVKNSMSKINIASNRLKFLEKMEKETENYARRKMDMIKFEKKKKEEMKMSKSLEVTFFLF